MPSTDTNSHQASIEVAASPEDAFAFLASGPKLDHWAIFASNRREIGDNLVVGTLKFSGNDVYIKVDADPDRLLVDYWDGDSPDNLRPSVEARVRRGEWLDRDPSVCVVTITVWIWPGADPEEWKQYYYMWYTQIDLIRLAIEHGL